MKISAEVRSALLGVVERDFPGATLSDAVGRLLVEHEDVRLRREIAQAYESLRADPAAWAGYVAELDEWDVVTSDGLDQA
jgi:hypothetical protein